MTNQIIGLVLPIDETTGCPVPFSYEARTADEIKGHMDKDKASVVYLVMAQPINEKHPPFILQLFGTGNVFTAQDVVNRWHHTQKELAKYGISIEGISSDGDPRLLAAMCNQMFSIPRCKMALAQDSIHIGTKLRNKLLQLLAELQMGNSKVSVEHLKKLIRCCSKEIHGLCLTDVSPVDRQNFASLQKTMLPRVLDALRKYVPESRATIKYLELCRDVTSSYMDFDLDPNERLLRIFRAAYFYRIWREFIKSSKYKLSEKFITPNAFKCIEINARNLLFLIRKFRDDGTPHLFIPTLFQSQTCEKTFRLFRAMGTVNYTKINFSIFELLYMIRRVEAMNDILHVRLLNKGVNFSKFQVSSQKTKMFSLPSEEQIADTLHQAKLFAIAEAKKFGMNADKSVFGEYPVKFKKFLSETDGEDLDENDIWEEEFDDFFNENDDDIDDNMNGQFDGKSKFVKVSAEDGSEKIILKSSLVWALSEKAFHPSKDRLKRVHSMNISTRQKRARHQ